jgi:hypothetical protein
MFEVNKIIPFETVLKDGFFKVGCFKDEMINGAGYDYNEVVCTWEKNLDVYSSGVVIYNGSKVLDKFDLDTAKEKCIQYGDLCAAITCDNQSPVATCTVRKTDSFGRSPAGEASYVKVCKTTTFTVPTLYDDIVPKPDRQPMSPSVCFEFCRTVPDVHFFGVHAGRKCYCMPAMKQIAGDDSRCDAVCEGDAGNMCGSMTKSSIFEMHMCDGLSKDLEKASTKVATATKEVDAAFDELNKVAKKMKKSAESVQEAYGNAGDVAASGLAQAAKVQAGKLLEATKAAKELSTEMGSMTTKAQATLTMVDGGTLDYKATVEAESLTADMSFASQEAMAGADNLTKLAQKTDADFGNRTMKANYSETYTDILYYIDRDHLGKPATCGGDLLGSPMVGSLEGCARACSNHFQDCVGFTWFDDELCFLISKFKTVTFYTKCEAKNGTTMTSCKAMFSKFVGTSLRPDPKGEGKNGVIPTKADRCVGA